MDLNKLTTADKVIAASGILLFLFSFLPWYGLGDGSRNGWDYFLFGIIPVLLGLLMVATVVVIRFTDVQLPDLPLPLAQLMLVAGGLAALLVLLRLVIGDSIDLGLGELGDALDIDTSIDLDRKYGLFLSFLATLGLVAGAFLKSKEPAESAAG